MTDSSVLITGASSGIGAALALRLAAPKRRLILVARDLNRLNDVAAACRAMRAECDVHSLDLRDPEQLSNLLREVELDRPIDSAFLNAGILDGRRTNEIVESAEAARNILKTNLSATVGAIHCLLPRMIERRRGTIVLVSSLAALIPLSDAPTYSASKAALLSYGLALRGAITTTGITVHIACPGYVASRMSDIHQGPRPGELTADQAAATIIKGVEDNRPIIGFPRLPFWLTLLSTLAPQSIRQSGMKGHRFHVADRS